MNLTSRNQDPIHASLALSSLLSVWYKPNSLNNKSTYNTLLLEFYICAKPRLTHWYPCPKKSAITFAQGCTSPPPPVSSEPYKVEVFFKIYAQLMKHLKVLLPIPFPNLHGTYRKNIVKIQEVCIVIYIILYSLTSYISWIIFWKEHYHRIQFGWTDLCTMSGCF